MNATKSPLTLSALVVSSALLVTAALGFVGCSSSGPDHSRHSLGSAAATVESVRLDPELREALAQRAARDHETTSSVIRKALRRYLDVA